MLCNWLALPGWKKWQPAFSKQYDVWPPILTMRDWIPHFRRKASITCWHSLSTFLRRLSCACILQELTKTSVLTISWTKRSLSSWKPGLDAVAGGWVEPAGDQKQYVNECKTRKWYLKSRHPMDSNQAAVPMSKISLVLWSEGWLMFRFRWSIC